MLAHLDPTQPFVVEADASSVALGAVLCQRPKPQSILHPCAYYSHKLTPVERNYEILDRELFDIQLALEEWQH